MVNTKVERKRAVVRRRKKRRGRLNRTRIIFIFFCILLILVIYEFNRFYQYKIDNKDSNGKKVENETQADDVEVDSTKKIDIVMKSYKNPDLDVKAKSVLLINAESGEILFNQKYEDKMFPASTTKILTAITALDYLKLDEVVRVGDEANRIRVNSSRAGLDYSEKITVENLIYALFLPSGNDAAQVIAVHTARAACGDSTLDIDTAKTKFIELMNKKAKDIGAKNSNFVTVDGYHDDNHYTTAIDLARITIEAMKNDFLCKVVKTDRMEIKDWKQYSKNDPKIRNWINTNLLIQKNSKWYMKEVTGFKTGRTPESGYCLIASAKEGEKNVLAVILSSTEEGVYEDAQKLLKYGLQN